MKCCMNSYCKCCRTATVKFKCLRAFFPHCSSDLHAAQLLHSSTLSNRVCYSLARPLLVLHVGNDAEDERQTLIDV